jgi:hypothetical protein
MFKLRSSPPSLRYGAAAFALLAFLPKSESWFWLAEP